MASLRTRDRALFLVRLTFALALPLALAAVPRLPAAAPMRDDPAAGAPLEIGMNLRMVGPSDRQLVFADAMKGAAPWRYVEPDGAGTPARPRDGGGWERGATAPEVPLDAEGWPTLADRRPVETRVFTDMEGHYPAGTYVCTHEGRGELEFGGAAALTERDGEGRLLVAVQPARGPIVVRIVSSAADEPLRRIRLWLPGLAERESPFNPAFVERVRPFRVLRFYPWMRPFSASGSWAARTTPASARQSGEEGVALEYMVALCNETGADPWFCMPHGADEDSVRAFATLVRERLHARARVWVELSNELWNASFPQARELQEQARQRGVRNASLVAETARAQFRVWREVFGEDAGRVVRVAAGQLHNPGYARALLRFLGDDVDALAIGAYFGLRAGEEGLDRESTPAEIMEAARRNLEERVLVRIGAHRALADEVSERAGRRVALVAYEGGPHVVARASLGGRDKRLALAARATSACQESPEMYTAYRRLLQGARERGLELFVAYDFVGGHTPADTFGHLEYLDEPLAAAPKLRALLEAAEGTPAGEERR